VAERPVVLIGSPFFGDIPSRMTMYRDEVIFSGFASGVLFGTIDTTETYISHAFNDIVRKFLDREEATHLFWYEQDMRPPPDVIERLLSLGVPIAGCAYISRDNDALPVCFNVSEQGAHRWTRLPEGNPDLWKVHGIGHGATLIERRVYEAIEPPWYDSEKIGQDVYFAQKAHAAGFDAIVDLRLWAGHVGPYEYGKEFYEWRRSIDGGKPRREES
jgi:hypothetical protein